MHSSEKHRDINTVSVYVYQKMKNRHKQTYISYYKINGEDGRSALKGSVTIVTVEAVEGVTLFRDAQPHHTHSILSLYDKHGT